MRCSLRRSAGRVALFRPVFLVVWVYSRLSERASLPDAHAPPAIHLPLAPPTNRGAADGRQLQHRWGHDRHDGKFAGQRGLTELQPAHPDGDQRGHSRGARVPGGRVLPGRRSGLYPLSGGQVLDLCHGGELGDVCLLRGRQVLSGGGRQLQLDLHRLSERHLFRDGGGQPGQRLPVLPGEFQFLFWVQAPAGVLVQWRLCGTKRGCLLSLQHKHVVSVGPGLPLSAQLSVGTNVLVARAMPVPAGLLRGHHDGWGGPHSLPGTHAHF